VPTAAVRAPRTERAYRSDWTDFEAWCRARRRRACPATVETVAHYVDAVAVDRRASTVRRRVAAVRAFHLDAGLPSPTTAPAVAAAVTRAEWRHRDDVVDTAPIDVESLRAMSAALPDTVAGARDRALLLVAYGAGLRPGELSALEVDDVRVRTDGMTVRIARGRVLVPFGSDDHLCSVQAWMRWRRASGIDAGPAFRAVDRHGRVGEAALGEKAATRIVRRAAARAGLDGTRWSGRSLRRGMVLAATAHGASDEGIMAHTGHRSRRLVRRYMADDAVTEG
jgi:site-specific recombinase XerD